MELDALAQSPLAISDLPARKEIRAIDLTRRPGDRPLWKSAMRGHPPAAPASDLPRAGFASPMGFWLTEASDGAPGAAASPYTIRFEVPSSAAARSASEARATAPLKARRPEQTVRL